MTDRLPGEEIARLSGRDMGFGKYLPGVPLLLFALAAHVGPLTATDWPLTGLNLDLTRIAIIALVTYGLMIVHELIHWVVLQGWGARARIRFGFWGGQVLTGDQPMTRTQFAMMLLAPLVLLTPLTCALTWWLYPSGIWWPVALAGTAHAAGCCVDAYLAAWMTRLPAGSLIVNRYPEPLRVFRPANVS